MRWMRRRVSGDGGHEAVGESLLLAAAAAGVLGAVRLGQMTVGMFERLTGQLGL